MPTDPKEIYKIVERKAPSLLGGVTEDQFLQIAHTSDGLSRIYDLLNTKEGSPFKDKMGASREEFIAEFGNFHEQPQPKPQVQSEPKTPINPTTNTDQEKSPFSPRNLGLDGTSVPSEPRVGVSSKTALTEAANAKNKNSATIPATKESDRFKNIGFNPETASQHPSNLEQNPDVATLSKKELEDRYAELNQKVNAAGGVWEDIPKKEKEMMAAPGLHSIELGNFKTYSAKQQIADQKELKQITDRLGSYHNPDTYSVVNGANDIFQASVEGRNPYDARLTAQKKAEANLNSIKDNISRLDQKLSKSLGAVQGSVWDMYKYLTSPDDYGNYKTLDENQTRLVMAVEDAPEFEKLSKFDKLAGEQKQQYDKDFAIENNLNAAKLAEQIAIDERSKAGDESKTFNVLAGVGLKFAETVPAVKQFAENLSIALTGRMPDFGIDSRVYNALKNQGRDRDADMYLQSARAQDSAEFEKFKAKYNQPTYYSKRPFEENVTVDGLTFAVKNGKVEKVYDKSGYEVLTPLSQKEYAAIKKYEANPDKYPTTRTSDIKQRLASTGLTTAQVIADMAPLIAVSAATGGSSAAMTTSMFGQLYGQYYNESLHNSGNSTTAAIYGSVRAGLEAWLETNVGKMEQRLGRAFLSDEAKKLVTGQIDDIAKRVAADDITKEQGIKEFFGGLGKEFKRSAIEENKEEILQQISGDLTAFATNQNELATKPSDYPEVIGETLLYTTLSVLPVSTLTHIASRNENKTMVLQAAVKNKEYNAALDNMLQSGSITEQQHKESKAFIEGVRNRILDLQALTSDKASRTKMAELAVDLTFAEKRRDAAVTDKSRTKFNEEIASINKKIDKLDDYDESLEPKASSNETAETSNVNDTSQKEADATLSEQSTENQPQEVIKTETNTTNGNTEDNINGVSSEEERGNSETNSAEGSRSDVAGGVHGAVGQSEKGSKKLRQAEESEIKTDGNTEDNSNRDNISKTLSIGSFVDYGGIKGIVIEDNGFKYVQDDKGNHTLIEGGENENATLEQLGVKELTPAKQSTPQQREIVADFSTNTITIANVPHQYVRANTTKGGEATVTVRDEKGNEKTIRNKDHVAEILKEKIIYESKNNGQSEADIVSGLENAARAVEAKPITTNPQEQRSAERKRGRVSESVRRRRKIENLKRISKQKFDKVDNSKKSLVETERELSEYAAILEDDVNTNPEYKNEHGGYFTVFDNSATEETDNPVSHKKNASLLGQALQHRVPKKVLKSLGGGNISKGESLIKYLRSLNQRRNTLLKENTPTAIASKMQDFKESNKEASDLEMEEKAASVSSRTFADTKSTKPTKLAQENKKPTKQVKPPLTPSVKPPLTPSSATETKETPSNVSPTNDVSSAAVATGETVVTPQQAEVKPPAISSETEAELPKEETKAEAKWNTESQKKNKDIAADTDIDFSKDTTEGQSQEATHSTPTAEKHSGKTVTTPFQIDRLIRGLAKNGFSGAKVVALRTMKLLLPTINKSGIKLIIHESNDSMLSAQASAGAINESKAHKGFYDNKTKELHINLANVTKDTPSHELIHPLIAAIAKNNPAAFLKFAHEVANDEVLGKDLAQFVIENYSADGTPPEDIFDEVITTYLGQRVADILEKKNGLNERLNPPLKRLIQLFKDLFRYLGLNIKPQDVFGTLSNRNGVKGFAHSLAAAFSRGDFNVFGDEVETNIKSSKPTVAVKPSKADMANAEKSATKDLQKLVIRTLKFSLSTSDNTPIQRTENVDGFKLLKKKFGETVAKSIRTHVPIALDYPTEFTDFITKKVPAKDDIAEILRLMGPRIDAMFRLEAGKQAQEIKATQSPEELAKLAEFEFIRPKDMGEVVASFRKDFKEGEVLCTITGFENSGADRFKNYFIFWLRKNDAHTVMHADDLDQEYLKENTVGARIWRGYLESKGRKNEDGSYNLNGLKPQRQDPYGTSSMSVQIDRRHGTISIKNRYNHTVNNPDDTYGGDLNSIVEGLHDAVYSINGVPKSNQETNLPEGIVSDGNKRLAVAPLEVINIRYGKNAYFKDGEIIPIDKSHQRIFDNYIFDSKSKTIKEGDGEDLVDGITNISFSDDKVIVDTENGNLIFGTDKGMLVSIEGSITELGYAFLYSNTSLTSLSLPALTQVGNYFLYRNTSLTSLSLPALTQAGNYFLYRNTNIDKSAILKDVKIKFSKEGSSDKKDLSNLSKDEISKYISDKAEAWANKVQKGIYDSNTQKDQSAENINELSNIFKNKLESAVTLPKDFTWEGGNNIIVKQKIKDMLGYIDVNHRSLDDKAQKGELSPIKRGFVHQSRKEHAADIEAELLKRGYHLDNIDQITKATDMAMSLENGISTLRDDLAHYYMHSALSVATEEVRKLEHSLTNENHSPESKQAISERIDELNYQKDIIAGSLYDIRSRTGNLLGQMFKDDGLLEAYYRARTPEVVYKEIEKDFIKEAKLRGEDVLTLTDKEKKIIMQQAESDAGLYAKIADEIASNITGITDQKLKDIAKKLVSEAIQEAKITKEKETKVKSKSNKNKAFESKDDILSYLDQFSEKAKSKGSTIKFSKDTEKEDGEEYNRKEFIRKLTTFVISNFKGDPKDINLLTINRDANKIIAELKSKGKDIGELDLKEHIIALEATSRKNLDAARVQVTKNKARINKLAKEIRTTINTVDKQASNFTQTNPSKGNGKGISNILTTQELKNSIANLEDSFKNVDPSGRLAEAMQDRMSTIKGIIDLVDGAKTDTDRATLYSNIGKHLLRVNEVLSGASTQNMTQKEIDAKKALDDAAKAVHAINAARSDRKSAVPDLSQYIKITDPAISHDTQKVKALKKAAAGQRKAAKHLAEELATLRNPSKSKQVGIVLNELAFNFFRSMILTGDISTLGSNGYLASLSLLSGGRFDAEAFAESEAKYMSGLDVYKYAFKTALKSFGEGRKVSDEVDASEMMKNTEALYERMMDNDGRIFKELYGLVLKKPYDPSDVNEFFNSSYANKIGEKLGRKGANLIQGSDLHMTTFRNVLAYAKFKQFYDNIPWSDPKRDEILKSYAKLVNVMIGARKIDNKILQQAMLAFKYLASRYTFVYYHSAGAVVDLVSKNVFRQKLNPFKEARLKDVSRIWMAQLLFLSAMQFILSALTNGGGGVERDWKDTNFLKIRIKDVAFDISPIFFIIRQFSKVLMYATLGLSQRTAQEMGLGDAYKTASQKLADDNLIGIFIDDLHGKLNSTLTFAIEMLRGRDFMNKRLSPLPTGEIMSKIFPFISDFSTLRFIGSNAAPITFTTTSSAFLPLTEKDYRDNTQYETGAILNLMTVLSSIAGGNSLSYDNSIHDYKVQSFLKDKDISVSDIRSLIGKAMSERFSNSWIVMDDPSPTLDTKLKGYFSEAMRDVILRKVGNDLYKKIDAENTKDIDTKYIKDYIKSHLTDAENEYIGMLKAALPPEILAKTFKKLAYNNYYKFVVGDPPAMSGKEKSAIKASDKVMGNSKVLYIPKSFGISASDLNY